MVRECFLGPCCYPARQDTISTLSSAGISVLATPKPSASQCTYAAVCFFRVKPELLAWTPLAWKLSRGFLSFHVAFFSTNNKFPTHWATLAKHFAGKNVSRSFLDWQLRKLKGSGCAEGEGSEFALDTCEHMGTESRRKGVRAFCTHTHSRSGLKQLSQQPGLV